MLNFVRSQCPRFSPTLPSDPRPNRLHSIKNNSPIWHLPLIYLPPCLPCVHESHSWLQHSHLKSTNQENQAIYSSPQCPSPPPVSELPYYPPSAGCPFAWSPIAGSLQSRRESHFVLFFIPSSQLLPPDELAAPYCRNHPLCE